ncbi:ferric reductase-like transmembrane domain-containing protein [uncultured Leifsonia sp.]|uniref:ferric reductase-like transmembrane domain-containing protein n=1 Tax=uncultured Leifsonia sp. TaxID=340359 RepID=UPI0028D76B8A|nr:ferric reductase-like transmembrane domain-containing protein [uncultured Leifsonia sp.]
MNEAMWALGRGSGVVALVLLTASLWLGIVTRSGRPLPGLPRFSVTLVHRNLALLSVVFVGLHILTLLADPYAKLTALDTVVPFLGTTKPFWLGLGTVAVDLMLAVVLTALLRRWIGRRVFKAVHWASYAMWPVAIAHTLGTGTDASAGWLLLLSGACLLVVVIAVLWRLSARFVESAAARRGELS